MTLHEEKDNKECVVEFDFLGKDSIRYNNSMPVEKRVFKNLQLFMDNKQPEDDLFDRLNVSTTMKTQGKRHIIYKSLSLGISGLSRPSIPYACCFSFYQPFVCQAELCLALW